VSSTPSPNGPGSGSAAAPTSGSSTLTTYRIAAAHVAERLRLKDFRDKVTDTVVDLSNYEMVIRYSDNSYAFVYNYGSVVFFNVPDAVQARELTRFRETKEAQRIGDTTEVFLVDEKADLGPKSNQVFFDRVEVGKITYAKIKIICMLVAESTALEYYDILIENLLEQATIYTKKLEAQGRFLESKEDLLKFVGQCLSAKQEIISNLYIVDSPDETWDNSELNKIFHELKQMLDIDVRYRAVEYKAKIIQESVEVITDLVKSRRETMLELTVILLIAFEVIVGFIRH